MYIIKVVYRKKDFIKLHFILSSLNLDLSFNFSSGESFDKVTTSE